MPLTLWEAIVGYKCEECGKPATHFYVIGPLCCECHGGGIVTNEEAEVIHTYYEKHKEIPEQQIVDKLIEEKKNAKNNR